MSEYLIAIGAVGLPLGFITAMHSHKTAGGIIIALGTASAGAGAFAGMGQA